jgi:UDP-N-acetylglucosamine transferase subunit ALG13
VIFLTIGTHEPFDRLVKAVDCWVAERGADVFGQVTDPGESGYRPQHFPWVGQMRPADYDAKVRAADFLIAHAGMGSIITALSHGKSIVVMPRRGHFQETRNDHQYATVAKLRGKPGILIAMDETDLPKVLDSALAGNRGSAGSLPPYAGDPLLDAVRAFIHASG